MLLPTHGIRTSEMWENQTYFLIFYSITTLVKQGTYLCRHGTFYKYWCQQQEA